MLPEPLRSEVRTAFATSIRNIWYTCIGLSALGLLLALPSKGLELAIVTDENWGLNRGDDKVGQEDRDLEAAGSSTHRAVQENIQTEKGQASDNGRTEHGNVMQGEFLKPAGLSL